MHQNRTVCVVVPWHLPSTVIHRKSASKTYCDNDYRNKSHNSTGVSWSSSSRQSNRNFSATSHYESPSYRVDKRKKYSFMENDQGSISDASGISQTTCSLSLKNIFLA